MNNKQSTPALQTTPPAAAGQGIPIKTVPCTLDQIARQISDHAAAGWLLQQHIRLYANDILLVFVQQ